MAKRTNYFSHDYHARNDSKLVKLRLEMGFEGIGLYWSLVEKLFEDGGKIPVNNIELIAKEWGIRREKLRKVIANFDLFITNDESIWSESVNKRLEKINEKSVKARESVNTRYGKVTDVELKNSDRNDNKREKEIESKTKSKVKEEKEPVAPVIRFEFPLVLPFASKEFSEVWDKLKRQKKWKNKSRDALESSLEKLGKQPEDVAIQMIKNCIAGEWMGLVEIKENNNGNKNNSGRSGSTALAQPSTGGAGKF